MPVASVDVESDGTVAVSLVVVEFAVDIAVAVEAKEDVATVVVSSEIVDIVTEIFVEVAISVTLVSSPVAVESV